MDLVATGINAVERGLVPDRLTRLAIRALCRRRLAEMGKRAIANSIQDFADSMNNGPIACLPELANRQHYEVPAEFFRRVLGPRLKYSCCHFPGGDSTLAEAEDSALELTCERAQLADGQRVLELGCGWGSLALWMADRFPNSRITSVSNSRPQREFIQQQCQVRCIGNLNVITADMNDFDHGGEKFDRVVSVEMFEHMRNWRLLLSRIAGWMSAEGRLFVHVFCHARFLYPFEAAGAANWMGQMFFSGGIMPSANVFENFREDLVVEKHDRWNGMHYARTLRAWLASMDSQREPIMNLLAAAHGPGQAAVWFNRWRMFFMACEELFGFRDGNEWFVSHYLLRQVR